LFTKASIMPWVQFICVRCGSERTGVRSNEAAIMSVQASRPSLAHPEDSQQCQCSGEFFNDVSGFWQTVLFISTFQKKFCWWFVIIFLNHGRKLNEERNAPVGCALRRLRKIAKSDCLLHVWPSVRMYLGSHWADLHEIWYLSVFFFRNSVGIIQVLLKSVKNNGYFTWRPVYVFDYICIISSWMKMLTIFEKKNVTERTITM
jgi:hypothetical protein